MDEFSEYREDKIRNEYIYIYIGDNIQVALIIEKM